jgi:hypothetical protein
MKMVATMMEEALPLIDGRNRFNDYRSKSLVCGPFNHVECSPRCMTIVLTDLSSLIGI